MITAADRREPTTATAALPAVTVFDVHKTYGTGEVAVHALRGVSLEVPAGQFVVMIRQTTLGS